MRLTSRLGSAGLAIYFWAFIIFLFAPLAVLLIFSVNKSPTPTLPLSGFSTKWFHEAFGNGVLTGALLRSIAIAIVAAVLATALGITASLGLLVMRGRAAALALTMLLLPLVVPYICLAVGLLILVQQVGAKPSLVAVVLGHCVIVLPFAILVILPRLRSLDPAMNEAAQDLGASAFASLRLITLPLLAPALVSSGIICFVTSFDEFAIASFLAPSGQPTYPVFLYASARTPALLPEVIAIGALIIAGSLLLVVIAEGGRRWAERRLVGQTAAADGSTAADEQPSEAFAMANG
ncbi:MAG TPA: ABC transporter permease [Streptosporangiaceae bacterium]|jgi:spermidine/putrescine transport system permease protein|nr:ABC transporter permease [Streptosporangiaceae bacterium]